MAERNFRKYKLVDADGTIVRKGITKRLLEVREAELLREETSRTRTFAKLVTRWQKTARAHGRRSRRRELPPEAAADRWIDPPIPPLHPRWRGGEGVRLAGPGGAPSPYDPLSTFNPSNLPNTSSSPIPSPHPYDLHTAASSDA